MSLHSHASSPISDETQRVARAAFPRGNLYLQVADGLGAIYHDIQFAALFPTRGQPAGSPARLALATVLQCAEGLSDRQAADAVRSRMDWQYVLGRALTDAGFDHTVLSECRTRLITGKAEHLLLDALLTLARARGLLKARGRHRTDSTHV
jgi:transposase